MPRRELRLCPRCAGYGHIEVDTSEGRNRDSEIRVCDQCKGSGRVIDIIFNSVSTAAFKYDYEEDRHELKKC